MALHLPRSSLAAVASSVEHYAALDLLRSDNLPLGKRVALDAFISNLPLIAPEQSLIERIEAHYDLIDRLNRLYADLVVLQDRDREYHQAIKGGGVSAYDRPKFLENGAPEILKEMKQVIREIQETARAISIKKAKQKLLGR